MVNVKSEMHLRQGLIYASNFFGLPIQIQRVYDFSNVEKSTRQFIRGIQSFLPQDTVYFFESKFNFRDINFISYKFLK